MTILARESIHDCPISREDIVELFKLSIRDRPKRG